MLPRSLKCLLTELTRAKNSRLRQLFDRQPCLRRQLLCRKAELTLLLRRLGRQLLCRKAQLPRRLRGR